MWLFCSVVKVIRFLFQCLPTGVCAETPFGLKIMIQLGLRRLWWKFCPLLLIGKECSWKRESGLYVQKTVKVNHLQRIKVSIALIIANPFNSLERNEFLSGLKISVFGGSPWPIYPQQTDCIIRLVPRQRSMFLIVAFFNYSLKIVYTWI